MRRAARAKNIQECDAPARLMRRAGPGRAEGFEIYWAGLGRAGQGREF